MEQHTIVQHIHEVGVHTFPLLPSTIGSTSFIGSDTYFILAIIKQETNIPHFVPMAIPITLILSN